MIHATLVFYRKEKSSPDVARRGVCHPHAGWVRDGHFLPSHLAPSDPDSGRPELLGRLMRFEPTDNCIGQQSCCSNEIHRDGLVSRD